MKKRKKIINLPNERLVKDINKYSELSTEDLQKLIDEMYPHDIAADLLALDVKEREHLYRFLTKKQIAEIVSYLEPELAADILEEFDLETQKEILDKMTVDDAVDILQAYEDDQMRSDIIETLREVEDIKDFILYDEDTVGAYMNNDYISFTADIDVKEAVKILISEAKEAETINTLFVVDREERFIGAVNLKTLVKARSPKLVEEIMISVPTVYDSSSINEAVFDMKNYEVFELPVINKDKELIGILTLDDVLDIAVEEAEEDFQKLAALPLHDDTKSKIKTALYRLPWLTILMVLSIPLISFANIMTAATAGIAILVFFQPLMLDSPGNVSTQTLAIALKTISNEGRMKFKDIIKEFNSGLITGLILGLTAFLISFFFVLISNISPEVQKGFTDIQVALIFACILGGSLTIVVALSPIPAIGIPHLLKLIKVDPAVASGPFITTIIDLIAALVYFGLATIILRRVGIII